ncbi:uncharacterized protein METZ01_LOCUS180843, partial [marine metagenome]
HHHSLAMSCFSCVAMEIINKIRVPSACAYFRSSHERIERFYNFACVPSTCVYFRLQGLKTLKDERLNYLNRLNKN